MPAAGTRDSEPSDMVSPRGTASSVGALILSATPGARLLQIRHDCAQAEAEAPSVLEFAAQFSSRGPKIQSPRPRNLPKVAEGRAGAWFTDPPASEDEDIDDVFRALQEIASSNVTPGADPTARPSVPPGISHDDIRAHEKSSAASGIYAPAAASALRSDLRRRTRQEGSDEAGESRNSQPVPRVTPPGLNLPVPASPARSGGSEHGGFDTARTDGTTATVSECCTEMSQMTTPRTGGPSAGSSGGRHSTHTENEEQMAPSIAAANRLFKAAELPLDQIDEDTDAELDMFRQQQEMIAQMCRVKADAYLAREKEKEEEEKRRHEQLQLMRLEQMQLIRLQELAEKRKQFQALAASRPTSAPVKRAEYKGTPARPSSFRVAALVEDLDVLNTSYCTETLSPGLQVRAAEAGMNEDLLAWNSPTRKVYSPGAEQKEAAVAGPEVSRVKPRPRSAFSRLMSSMGTKRWRAAIVPLPKSLITSSPGSFIRGMSFGASRREPQTEAWASVASKGISIVPFPSSHDAEHTAPNAR